MVSTVADSYLNTTSHYAGSVAETASPKKVQKYSSIPPGYIFQPTAFETHGSLNSSGLDLLREVGCHLTASSGDLREMSFLFQRLSILIQLFNSVLMLESFTPADEDPHL